MPARNFASAVSVSTRACCVGFAVGTSAGVVATLPLQPLFHPRSLLLARRSVHGLIPSPLAVEEFSPVYLGNLVFLPFIDK